VSQPRIRKCADSKEFERVVDDLAIQGYKIKSRSDTTALLTKSSFGGVGIHILFFLISLGILNLIYALVKYSGREQVLVRIED
jgi:hypothetical protein